MLWKSKITFFRCLVDKKKHVKNSRFTSNLCGAALKVLCNGILKLMGSQVTTEISGYKEVDPWIYDHEFQNFNTFFFSARSHSLTLRSHSFIQESLLKFFCLFSSLVSISRLVFCFLLFSSLNALSFPYISGSLGLVMCWTRGLSLAELSWVLHLNRNH